MKKGFVHMIEVIVVIVMAFFAFFQFAYITTPDTDWERTKLLLMGQDALSVMDMSGTNWFDAADVESRLNKLIPGKNIVYSMRLDNVIKQNIRIGCLCDDAMISAIEGALLPDPLRINNERIRFAVEKADSLSSLLNPAYDVAIIDSHQNLQGARNDIIRFLSYDRGIIEIEQLSESDISSDSVQSDIFGLGWSSSGLSSSSGRISFSSGAGKPGPDTYTIYKYFHAFPNTTEDGTFRKGTDFVNFLGEGSGVLQKDSNSEKVLLMQIDTGMPACIINHGISETKGRSAWISQIPLSGEAEKNLMKSLISWAAGGSDDIKKASLKNPVTASIYRVYNSEMFQIIKVELTLDYL